MFSETCKTCTTPLFKMIQFLKAQRIQKINYIKCKQTKNMQMSFPPKICEHLFHVVVVFNQITELILQLFNEQIHE